MDNDERIIDPAGISKNAVTYLEPLVAPASKSKIPKTTVRIPKPDETKPDSAVKPRRRAIDAAPEA